jgi:hypothetical protein
LSEGDTVIIGNDGQMNLGPFTKTRAFKQGDIFEPAPMTIFELSEDTEVYLSSPMIKIQYRLPAAVKTSDVNTNVLFKANQIRTLQRPKDNETKWKVEFSAADNFSF